MANPSDVRNTIDTTITTNNNNEITGALLNAALNDVVDYVEEVQNAGVENASIVENQTTNPDATSIYTPWLDKVTKILRFKSLIPEQNAPLQIKPKTGTGSSEWFELAWNVVSDVPFGFKKITNLLAGTAASHAATKGQMDIADAATLASANTYSDGLVIGLLDDRGNYDASGGGYPTTGGSGTAGAILKGDIWRISVTGAVGNAGNWIRALVDTPGQTAGNWSKVADGGSTGITGTGTTGNLPKFTGAATVGDSIIKEASGSIGVGTANAMIGVLNVQNATNGSGTPAFVIERTSFSAGVKVLSIYTPDGASCSMDLGGNSQIIMGSQSATFGVASGSGAFRWDGTDYRFFISGTRTAFFDSNGFSFNLGGTSSPNASAIIDIGSTTKGVLFPRMTTTQKNAISTPAAGLQVYDTTLNQMSYYNGTTWINF